MKTVLRIIGKILLRLLLLVITTVVLLAGGIYGAIYTLNYGPSSSARSLFVNSVLETSALKFLATLVLPADEVATIIAENRVVVGDVVTNPDLIRIPEKQEEAEISTEKELELVNVSGLTYKGIMMIVKDPSRVYVGTCKNINKPSLDGEKLGAIMKREDAVAGINGGGFSDEGGKGTGSIPLGFVFSKGQYFNGSDTEKELLIGFDTNDKLIVGEMTAKEARELGIRDALSFGPALIINGVPVDFTGQSSGLNPRTAIGQRADGAVLLLVIDGRQANSLGARYSDLMEVMLEFGAVNAANLDGGSSSQMIYKGERISNLSIMTGDRELPTCFLVERRPSDGED